MADPKEDIKTEVADSDTLKIRLENAKTTPPLLVVISGRPLGKSFYLTKDVMVLGRDLSADVSITETSISRRHAEFTRIEKGVEIKDLGSTNGVYVNDAKITTKMLEDGDLVRCGNTIFKFLKEGQIENVHYGQMYEIATTDHLTQVFNKKAIFEIIQEEFVKCQTSRLPLSLVVFDIDHFKKVNDTYGHPAGDYVLKETCYVIKNKLTRFQDALGRYGGEEFILTLRETPLKIAVDVAERIRATIEKHTFQFDGKQIPITVSLGVATLDSTTANAEALISLCDKALYEAKNQGRNKVCVR